MLYTLSLTAHLLGAITLLALFLGSVIAIWGGAVSTYGKLLVGIGINALIQIVSGLGLFFGSQNTMSGGQFCARLSVYIVLTIMFESILGYQLLKSAAEPRYLNHE